MGSDRQLFRFDFSEPLDLERQSLAIYLDADADAATGRADGENAGAEEQAAISRNEGEVKYESFLYQHDGFRRPGSLGWIGTIGDAVYAVFEVSTAQEGGESRFGLGWLTQVKASDGQTLASEKNARTLVTSRAAERLARAARGAPAAEFGAREAGAAGRHPPVHAAGEPRRPQRHRPPQLGGPGPGAPRPDAEPRPRPPNFTLANHLHRVELPAGEGEASRFARVEALTTGLALGGVGGRGARDGRREPAEGCGHRAAAGPRGDGLHEPDRPAAHRTTRSGWACPSRAGQAGRSGPPGRERTRRASGSPRI